MKKNTFECAPVLHVGNCIIFAIIFLTCRKQPHQISTTIKQLRRDIKGINRCDKPKK